MINPQTCRIRRSQKAVDKKGEGHSPSVNRLCEGDVTRRSISEAMAETGEGQEEAKECCGADESDEISVVAPANTIVDPNAMVVLGFYTIIANSAMVTPGRSPDVAGLAVFCRHVHGRRFQGG